MVLLQLGLVVQVLQDEAPPTHQTSMQQEQEQQPRVVEVAVAMPPLPAPPAQVAPPCSHQVLPLHPLPAPLACSTCHLAMEPCLPGCLCLVP